MDNEINIDTEAGMEAAKLWVTNMLAMLNPVATWGLPRSMALYEINQPEKRLIRILEDRADESSELVFKALGYTVHVMTHKGAENGRD